MNNKTLRFENLAFAGTRGVSKNNAKSGFAPAFLHCESGRIVISRTKGGQPAPFHLIDWLPEEWAESTREDGSIKKLIPEIVSGFSRNGQFYTREETASL